MFTEERKYDYSGKLILKKSHILKEECCPRDDKVNWLFMKAGENLYSFVYKIESPLEATYGKPFKAKFAFTMSNEIRKIVKTNQVYKVFRGPEPIGEIILQKMID